jgi:hypothetical protein
MLKIKLRRDYHGSVQNAQLASAAAPTPQERVLLVCVIIRGARTFGVAHDTTMIENTSLSGWGRSRKS